MGAIASQITSPTIVYSTFYSGADQRKHQSSASLAFVRGFHRWPVNSPHKWPVTRKMFPFDDVIMLGVIIVVYCYAVPSRQLICELDENPWVLDLQMSCSDLTWRWAPILDNGHQDDIIILSVLPDSRDNSKRGGWYYQWASRHKGLSQLRRQNPNEMGKHCNESWRLKFPANRLLVIQIFQSNNNGNIRAVYCRPFIRGIYCCAAHSLAEGQ